VQIILRWGGSVGSINCICNTDEISFLHTPRNFSSTCSFGLVIYSVNVSVNVNVDGRNCGRAPGFLLLSLYLAPSPLPPPQLLQHLSYLSNCLSSLCVAGAAYLYKLPGEGGGGYDSKKLQVSFKIFLYPKFCCFLFPCKTYNMCRENSMGLGRCTRGGLSYILHIIRRKDEVKEYV
jgi:hypothetical protein